jgi:hypothetical protein
MKYIGMMGADGPIYIPSFMKIASGVQTGRGGGYSQTHRQHEDRISLL